MQKKKIFFAGAILCLLVAGWGYYQYQKPRTTAAGETAAYTLMAEQLFKEYSTNEMAAEKKYVGRVLQISGIVAAVEKLPNATNILLVAGTETSGVNCSIARIESTVAIGEQVTVKGRCTGFLMDVSLVDAVLITD